MLDCVSWPSTLIGRPDGNAAGLCAQVAQAPGQNPFGSVSYLACVGTGEKGSRPVSRVLSGAAIHLRCASPHTCSDLPGRRARAARCSPRAALSPIWSCSGWGLPSRGVLPPARCALTAPFHPCRRRDPALGRSRLCGTFRGLAPPRRYLAPCPAEPGLSSALARRGCLADSRLEDRRRRNTSQRCPGYESSGSPALAPRASASA